MRIWQKNYLHRYYHRDPKWKSLGDYWQQLLRENVPHHATALEVGPGPCSYPSEFLSSVAQTLVGLDVDPRVSENAALAKAHVYDGHRFPFADNSFHVAVSRWVHEHLADPVAHCAEVHRVLLPGGKYIFRTPNLLHYVSLAAWLTPHQFHAWLVPWLKGDDSNEVKPYPTYYRFNTRQRIHSTLTRIGFSVQSIELRESYPHYGLASRFLFLPLMLYERVVNSTIYLEELRHTIDVVAVKRNVEG
jgi:SAM-dependent methyltransferase